MFERLSRWRRKHQLLKSYADACIGMEQAAMFGDWPLAISYQKRADEFKIEYAKLCGKEMTVTSYRNLVYWKEQCKFCENSKFCKYRDKVELLQARLRVVELETTGCYGTLSFWCDYYSEDEQKVADAM